MFTENVKLTEEHPRGRGRPPGRTSQGQAAQLGLYKTAISLISERGYEAATLRDVAKREGVSVGLLYRYFPSKSAVVLRLYDELSADYAGRGMELKAGRWRERFSLALNTSLQVLAPHRRVLAALVPVLVGDANEGLFAPPTAFSRQRVQKVFQDAVMYSTDAPRREVAEALAGVLYLIHLAIILFWLLDQSPRQRATTGLLELIKAILPAAALTLRFPRAQKLVIAGNKLFQEAFLGERPVSTPKKSGPED